MTDTEYHQRMYDLHMECAKINTEHGHHEDAAAYKRIAEMYKKELNNDRRIN